jgi:hypothetical protein
MKWQEQLPKWHPLHRVPEEHRMMPGTERALIALSESTIPRLSKAVELLTKALTTPLRLHDGSLQPGVVQLALTREQWVELVEAISSKATQVRDGRYGSGEEEPRTDVKKWTDDLDALGKAVSDALTAAGISL